VLGLVVMSVSVGSVVSLILIVFLCGLHGLRMRVLAGMPVMLVAFGFLSVPTLVRSYIFPIPSLFDVWHALTARL